MSDRRQEEEFGEDPLISASTGPENEPQQAAIRYAACQVTLPTPLQYRWREGCAF
jgi:hypothetical protein